MADDTNYVWVAAYKHRHGTDTRVFRSEALATEWKNETAKLYWEEQFADDAMPADDQIGTAYFDLMTERYSLDDVEFFDIEKCEVEG